LNYRRCLRILGRWTVPDRSSWIADSRPSDDHFARLFVDSPKDPDTNPELIASIQQLVSISNDLQLTPETVDSKLTPEPFPIVTLRAKSDVSLIIVKSPKSQSAVEQETTILKQMNHPLVMKIPPTQ
jgi:hypothetical protein